MSNSAKLPTLYVGAWGECDREVRSTPRHDMGDRSEAVWVRCSTCGTPRLCAVEGRGPDL